MSSLLRAKRALERRVGPVRFVRTPDHHLPLELHGPEWTHDECEVETTWLGAGETHIEAISDAYDTLRVRARIERREGGC